MRSSTLSIKANSAYSSVAILSKTFVRWWVGEGCKEHADTDVCRLKGPWRWQAMAEGSERIDVMHARLCQNDNVQLAEIEHKSLKPHPLEASGGWPNSSKALLPVELMCSCSKSSARPNSSKALLPVEFMCSCSKSAARQACVNGELTGFSPRIDLEFDQIFPTATSKRYCKGKGVGFRSESLGLGLGLRVKV